VEHRQFNTTGHSRDSESNARHLAHDGDELERHRPRGENTGLTRTPNNLSKPPVVRADVSSGRG
jgi:hypothetical protein